MAMQHYALTVDKFLEHAAKWHGDVEVVAAEGGAGGVRRIRYAALRERSNRLSGSLLRLGLKFGDRVATLAWNTVDHFEMYFAIMGVGLVCHTLNPRVSLAHLARMIGEADDAAIAVGVGLAEVARQLLPLCPSLKHVIYLDEKGVEPGIAAPGLKTGYATAELLESLGEPVEWGRFHEDAVAGICHTSGTSGLPKGVVYSHRSNYLHTLRGLQADALGFTAADVVLIAVPMFHANGWGLPFAAPAVGAKIVLPGRNSDGRSLATLMRDESVTVAAGVQTVWLGVLEYLEETGGHLPALERIIIGGSTCPEALIRRMQQRLGVVVQTSWGMTELSPMGTICPANQGDEAVRGSGRPLMGLDLKLVDEGGKTLPQQRDVVGHLRVKGHSVVARYLGQEEDVLDDEGYFSTHDLATIDAAGNIKISGRWKDLVKSGGEWINPSEVEEIVGRLPEVGLVAVIGVPHVRWGERPVLFFEARKDRDIDAGKLLEALRGVVPDWWLPDEVIRIERMPLAATGKIDKNQLRADYANREPGGR
jgi:acyl-CoA synthetase (AMP-forming)/AMP-acid ligase II